MLKNSTLPLLAFLCLSFVIAPVPVQAETIAAAKTVLQGSPILPVIVGVNGLPNVANPFDPAQIRVVASIARPNGTTI